MSKRSGPNDRSKVATDQPSEQGSTEKQHPDLFVKDDKPLRIFVAQFNGMGAIRTGIQDHGGMVVNTPASADKIIVDRPSTLDGAVLMKEWVTESIEAGKLLPERPYSAKKVKAKRVRTNFTVDDDEILKAFVKSRGLAISYGGNDAFIDLAAKYPHHTMHSWRERWIKTIAPVLKAQEEAKQRTLQFSTSRLPFPPTAATARSSPQKQRTAQQHEPRSPLRSPFKPSEPSTSRLASPNRGAVPRELVLEESPKQHSPDLIREREDDEVEVEEEEEEELATPLPSSSRQASPRKSPYPASSGPGSKKFSSPSKSHYEYDEEIEPHSKERVRSRGREEEIENSPPAQVRFEEVSPKQSSTKSRKSKDKGKEKLVETSPQEISVIKKRKHGNVQESEGNLDEEDGLMDTYLQSVAHVDDERNEPPSKKMKNVSEIVLNSSPPRQRTHSRSPSKSPEYFRSPPPSQKSATMTPQRDLRAEGSRNEQLIWSPSTSKLLDSITELPPDEGIRILCELSGQSKEVVLSVMYECSLNAKNCLDVLRRGHGGTKSLWWTPEEDIILEHSTNPQERHKLRVSKGNKSMSRRRDFLQTARREGWLDQMYNVVENVKNGIE